MSESWVCKSCLRRAWLLFLLQLAIMRALAQGGRGDTVRTRGLLRPIFQAVEEAIKSADTGSLVRGKPGQERQARTTTQVLRKNSERFIAQERE